MGHWFTTLKDKIISRKGYNKFVKQLEALSILEVYNVLLSPGKKESCMTFYRPLTLHWNFVFTV